MRHKYYDVTLTCKAAAMNANDLIADTQTIVNTGAGYLNSLELFNLDDQDDQISIYFIRSSTSMGTEGSSFTLSDTDALEVMSKVVFSSGAYVDFADNLWQVKTSTHADSGMGVWLENAAPGTDGAVYVAAVLSAGAGTYTASGLKLRVGMNHLA